MPSCDVEVSVAVARTPRVVQVESLFDVPPAEKATLNWHAELPFDERPWNVGLIVGPSGAGKSTLARKLFGASLVEGYDWPADRSILDAFGEQVPTAEIVEMLTAVGLSSAPAWLRPFRVLSTGEKFRATIARALLEGGGLIAMDEYSSVVDRQVAQVGAHATQRAVRRHSKQFVAISCHYDIIDWLQPDWTFEPATGIFTWRVLQRRPAIELHIHKCKRSLWRMFARHHYMSANINPASQTFVALVDGRPVAFNSYRNQVNPGVKTIRANDRLVVLPDWQGLGIGPAFNEWLGQYLYERGLRFHCHTAHHGLVRYYAKSPRWRRLPRTGFLTNTSVSRMIGPNLKLRRLNVYSFAYCPPVT